MQMPIDWLLEGEPWVEYRTRLDMLNQADEDSMVVNARERMVAHPLTTSLVHELADWPGGITSNHKRADQPFHKLAFLADLGIRTDDPGIGEIVARIQAHTADEGPNQIRMKIPTHFGGSGVAEWSWMLCDAPLVLYGLIKFGLAQDAGVQAAMNYLVGLVRENGWPCAAAKQLGTFRGPGRKDDPCPYANLVMLKLCVSADDWRDHSACHLGAESLLSLWSQSRERHPYLFKMGTDFRKLKVPFIWYDLLHVLEVLTQFEWLRDDPRLREMTEVLRGKADEQGRFKLESVWMTWKDWGFTNKKEPSRWATLMAWRILKRLQNL
ncbi:MAG: hypothetical protein JW750_02735 [Anaerolineaceae bacterium]|nr:hypothetical protein [Anaerolineaceae bacterium]